MPASELKVYGEVMSCTRQTVLTPTDDICFSFLYLLFRAWPVKNGLVQDDFRHLMRNLPVPVADEDIEQMFDYADTDKDGRLSYKEFQVRRKNEAMGSKNQKTRSFRSNGKSQFLEQNNLKKKGKLSSSLNCRHSW